MPVALLAGAFGQGNLGDEALLQAFATALPDWHLVVTTGDPAPVEALGCEPVSARSPGLVARRACAVDAVVVGGGTVFKALHPSSGRWPLALLANTAALMSVASAARHPVAMVGVGAGRLEGRSARSLARSAVRHADLLVLRDEASAWAMTGVGVPGPLRVGADPAWTLLRAPGEGRAAQECSVRLVPSRLAAIGGDASAMAAMVAQLTAIVRLLVDAGVEVQLQAWQRSPEPGVADDRTIVDQVVRRVGPRGTRSVAVVPTPASLSEAAASMAGVGALVSYRFHALLAASAAGVPSVAVVHEAKLGALAQRLDQRAVPVEATSAAVAAEAMAALEAPGPAPAVVRELIDRAEDGFRLLRVLLAGGQSDEVDALGALPLAPA